MVNWLHITGYYCAQAENMHSQRSQALLASQPHSFQVLTEWAWASHTPLHSQYYSYSTASQLASHTTSYPPATHTRGRGAWTSHNPTLYTASTHQPATQLLPTSLLPQGAWGLAWSSHNPTTQQVLLTPLQPLLTPLNYNHNNSKLLFILVRFRKNNR